MALVEDIFGDVFKKAGPTVLVGIGVALIAPILLPAAVAGLRPLTKSAIKGFLTMADKMKEMVAESGEQMSDLVAEARAEREAELAAAASAAATAAAAGPQAEA